LEGLQARLKGEIPNLYLQFLRRTLSFPARVKTGDTLFGLGCGRLFEGNPQQMWDSLSKFVGLPDTTYVFCAHEYTQVSDQARTCIRAVVTLSLQLSWAFNLINHHIKLPSP
jgi:hypothetical protein